MPDADQSYTILVIEKDERSKEVIARSINEAEIGDCVFTEDVLKGLKICLLNPPDALVLSLDLPGLPGEEALRMIRGSSTLAKLPVIVVASASQTRRKEIQMLDSGADYYLWKPLSKRRFLRCLATLLAQNTEVKPDEPTPDLTSNEFINKLLDRSFGDTQIRKSPSQDKFLLPGHQFRGFEIISRLGELGFSTIYRARQLSLDRPVTIKVLKKTERHAETVIPRFNREIEIMSRLQHRNIVNIFDAGEVDDFLFIAMEHIEAGNLRSIIKKRALELDKFMLIALQACNALSYLHGEGVLHRDIRPESIFLMQDDTVKLGEFWTSSLTISENKKTKWGTSRLATGRRYIAPELLRGDRSTPQSDQYSLAKTLLRSILNHGDRVEPDNLRRIRKDIPRKVSLVFERAMSANPSDRYPSIFDFKSALRTSAGVQDHPKSNRPK